jgi:exosortase
MTTVSAGTAKRKRHSIHRVSTPASESIGPDRRLWLALVLTTGVTLGWAYWSTLADLWREWRHNDDYSVGPLVPLVAAFLLWRQRAKLRDCRITPCWWGAGLILLAAAVQTYGLLFLFESAERYALVLAIWGLVLLIAGWRFFRQVRWVLLFLLLMIPFPGRIHNLINGPLQSASSRGAVFLLEAFGVIVSRDGNVVTVNNIQMNVVEACSGLRMLMSFIVVAATLAFVIARPRWQKAVLVVSSVPIAVGSNIVRLAVTGVLRLLTSSESASNFVHDFAGWMMMPPAFFVLLGELWLMNRIVVPDKPSHPSTRAKDDHKSGNN